MNWIERWALQILVDYYRRIKFDKAMVEIDADLTRIEARLEADREAIKTIVRDFVELDPKW